MLVVRIYFRIFLNLLILTTIWAFLTPVYSYLSTEKNNQYSLELISESNHHLRDYIMYNTFIYRNFDKNLEFMCNELKRLGFSKDKKYFYGVLDYKHGKSSTEKPVNSYDFEWEYNKKYYCPKYFVLNLEKGLYLHFDTKKEFDKELNDKKIKLYTFNKYVRKYNKRINLTKLGEQNSEELSRYAQDEMVY